MCYKTLEFYSYEGIPAVQMKQALEAFGLLGVSSIFALDELERELNQQIEYSLTIGARYISFLIPPDSEINFSDKLQFQTLVSRIQKVGKEIKRNGLIFTYHPEAPEFERIGGQLIFDRLLEEVGGGLLQLELDMYWVKKAGLDPKTTLKKYSGHVPLVHVKDLERDGDFTEVGRGIMDWPSIFPVFNDVGVEYYFVEQNVSPHPLKSVKISLEYLKSIGFA